MDNLLTQEEELHILLNTHRAEGRCLCEVCGKELRQHPLDYRVLFNGEPFLNKICGDWWAKL